MQTTWQKGFTPKKYPKLVGDINVDVVIVGGGISGIMSAYFLTKRGKRVAVLEKASLSESTTAYTTAFITYDVDTSLRDLSRGFGEDDGKAVWASGREAIDTIEAIARAESIDCEFKRTPEYVYGTTIKEWCDIKEEAEYGKKLGFDIAVSVPLSFPIVGAIEMRNQAKFHPLKFLDGVRDAAEREGALFFEGTEVMDDIDGGDFVQVTTANGRAVGKYLIIATYKSFKRLPELFLRSGMYVSYVYELSIPHGKIKEGLYLDGHNPYHYFRVDVFPDQDRMIIGGEDHRKEIPIAKSKNFQALKYYIDNTFPGLTYKIEKKWSGDILEPTDGLPLIGRYDKKHPNRFVISAFSGNGMTYGVTGARVISDIIAGNKNPYIVLYNPRRPFRFKELLFKTRDYVGEFFGGVFKNLFQKS